MKGRTGRNQATGDPFLNPRARESNVILLPCPTLVGSIGKYRSWPYEENRSRPQHLYRPVINLYRSSSPCQISKRPAIEGYLASSKLTSWQMTHLGDMQASDLQA